MKLNFGNAGIFVVIKGIEKITPDVFLNLPSSINIYGFMREIIEWPYVIQASYVVLMSMSYQNGSERFYTRP